MGGTIDGNTPYPGFWALVPSLGAATVLASGAHAPDRGVGYALSLRPLQAIGRVSYAWYLWHWPVLLLGVTILDAGRTSNRVALAGVSLLIAAVSYHFFEEPLRKNDSLLKRPGYAVAGAIAVMILSNALALRWHNAVRDHLASAEMHRYMDARSDLSTIYVQGCDERYFSDTVKFCAFGAIDAPHTALAIGDSVALQWFPAYEQLYVKPGWRLLVATKSACPMVDAPIYYARIGREFTECERWRNALLEQAAVIRPDLLILGSTYTYDFTQSQWIDGTARILKALAPTSGHLYIMRSTPVLAFDGPSCLEPRSWLYQALSPRAACASPARDPRSDSVFRWLGEAARSFGNVTLLDMTDAICPDGTCHAERDGVIVYRDTQHLTATYARLLTPELNTRMEQAIPESPSHRDVPESTATATQ